MTIKHMYRFIVSLAVCLVATAQAQQVLVLPGATSTKDTFSIFAAQPFAFSNTIQAGPGAFLAFVNPAGTRYYVVTSSKLVVTQTNGTQVASIAFGQPVNGAALAPDGSRLVVVGGTASSGSVTVLDVSGDGASQVASLSSITNPLDVAISLDGATAYVINAAGITPVDLGNNTAGTLVSLAGLTPSGTVKPGVSVGPNGLVYVNANNALYELNPATLGSAGTIPVVGFPGKPAFWTDATSAVIINQRIYNTSTREGRAWVLDMTKHAVSRTMLNSSKQFTQAFYASPTKIYVTSPTSYVFSFPPTSTTTLTPLAPGVSSAAISGEATTPKYLFVATSDKLMRYDIADDSSTSLSLATPPGATFYVQPTVGRTEATLKTFNAAQSVARGATALPFVVRVLNSNGLPVAGVAVKWAAGGVTLTGAMTATNAQGYAIATGIAPKSDGTYYAHATFPDSLGVLNGTTFALTVTATSGGGGTSTAEGLSMVGGNGQVLMGGSPSIAPLEVLATDASGAAAQGAAVTFTIAAAQGSLTTSTGTSSCVSTTTTTTTALTCTTDSDGHASVLFQPLALTGDSANVVSRITASTTTGSGTAKTVTFYETTLPS
ncbi:MAG TPA: hypothetical protein VGL77_15860, partial [Armatimonadota bacterium]